MTQHFSPDFIPRHIITASLGMEILQNGKDNDSMLMLLSSYKHLPCLLAAMWIQYVWEHWTTCEGCSESTIQDAEIRLRIEGMFGSIRKLIDDTEVRMACSVWKIFDQQVDTLLKAFSRVTR